MCTRPNFLLDPIFCRILICVLLFRWRTPVLHWIGSINIVTQPPSDSLLSFRFVLMYLTYFFSDRSHLLLLCNIPCLRSASHHGNAQFSSAKHKGFELPSIKIASASAHVLNLSAQNPPFRNQSRLALDREEDVVPTTTTTTTTSPYPFSRWYGKRKERAILCLVIATCAGQ